MGAWEYLVVTRFSSQNNPEVWDTGSSDVNDGRASAAVSPENSTIEICVPWDMISGTPTDSLHFTLITTITDPNDNAWWVTSNPGAPNTLDAVTNYGDPTSPDTRSTDLEVVGDSDVDYLFEVWFHLDPDIEPSPPLVINEVLYNVAESNQWIELYNRTGGQLGLSLPSAGAYSGYRLSNGITVDGSGGTFGFPEASVAADDVVLVANTATDYLASYLGHPAPDFEVKDSNETADMLLDPYWSVGSTLTLANPGNLLLLESRSV